jgi:CheY-like chemotaxis protein
MRILILEDDTKIADFVSNGLKQAGFAVDKMGDGEEGLHFGLNNAYDAAVVDIMLPGCDGLSVIDQWRKARIATPVIILSAKHSVDDRVRGLQAGGDDYLTNPPGDSYVRANDAKFFGSFAQPANSRGHSKRQKNRTSSPGIFVARIPAAQSRARPFENDDPGARLGLRIRSKNECRRCTGLPPAE